MLNSPIYPVIFKLHKNNPIPKIAGANTIDNFRFIALLSSIDKIFERLKHIELLKFFEDESLICKSQFEYMKGGGTVYAILIGIIWCEMA